MNEGEKRMNQTPHQHQPYCDQLLLDCNDPIFQGSLFVGNNGNPTKKMRDLHSPNSEDAVTWSVFRLLDCHFADSPWLPELLTLAGCRIEAAGQPEIAFWKHGCPSKERLLWLLNHTQDPRVAESGGASEDPKRLSLVRQHLDEYTRHINDGKTRSRRKWILEGPTEFDVIIRCPGLMVAVEAKLYSDVSTKITWDAGRDQISRVVDVGLEVARQESREFCFLLISDRRQHDPPKHYERLMPECRANPPAGLSADHLGWLTWGGIYDWLAEQKSQCSATQVSWIDKMRGFLAQRSLT